MQGVNELSLSISGKSHVLFNTDFNFHSPSKSREIKQAASASYFLPQERGFQPSGPALAFVHLPPSMGGLGMVYVYADGDSAYGSCQRELRGGVKREDMLPLTPQWELPFRVVPLSALRDWQQGMIQSLSCNFPCLEEKAFPTLTAPVPFCNPIHQPENTFSEAQCIIFIRFLSIFNSRRAKCPFVFVIILSFLIMFFLCYFSASPWQCFILAQSERTAS